MRRVIGNKRGRNSDLKFKEKFKVATRALLSLSRLPLSITCSRRFIFALPVLLLLLSCVGRSLLRLLLLLLLLLLLHETQRNNERRSSNYSRE